MAKTTTIINHLEGMDEDTKAVVGTTGQIQLIKHETDKEDILEDIHEFYDTIEDANAAKLAWESE